ncbi:hypothetical protein [Paractinoplanes globisporus]|uniref:Uncharacterized protein n=1 Tax=Paractinoplanes globisporus TaxID=113565 RepID=A0ABW6WCP4_9ACTN|nr:hypothetical protein [Actinoplanes globisporus]
MRVMARLPAVLAVGWAASWTIIFLEIFRWHHMSRTLRFTPPAPLPGMPGPPTPGLPVLTACFLACVTPPGFVAAVLWNRHTRKIARRRGGEPDAG